MGDGIFGYIGRAFILTASALFLSLAAMAASGPKVVNGQGSTDFPAVGALVSASDRGAICTATLIGCRTVLTAAHCLCQREECDVSGPLVPASSLAVSFQYGPVVRVASYDVHPNFSDREQVDDVAILHLTQSVPGIAPATINTTRTPSFGTRGTVLGYGLASENNESSAGIKRIGRYSSINCNEDGLPNATNLCFFFAPSDAGICSGDSGGPDFVDFGQGPVLAGIHTASTSCSPGAISLSQDVYSYRNFIAQQAGSDLGRACTDLPLIGSSDVTTRSWSGAASGNPSHTFNVPAGTERLRLALNATEPPGGDLDLLLRAGAPPTDGLFDCRSDMDGSVEFCEVVQPAAGTWHATVARRSGSGVEYQLTLALFGGDDPGPSPPAAPSGLGAQASSPEEIRLSWTDRSDDETEFLVERRRGSGSYGQIAALDPNSTSYTDRSVAASTTYSYRVRARNGAGASSYTNVATATTPTAPSGPCVADETTLCLNSGRFQVRVAWRDGQGQSGSAKVAPAGTVDSGLIYFFDPSNWEMLIKVLDACSINQRFWVYAAATTDLGYTLEVVDTETGVGKTYTNPVGVASPAVTDATAFATCP